MILPRFIRAHVAASYLGMDRNRFNADVRPTLTEIPIGERGIAFDRQELDDWADFYKESRGRPGRTGKGRSTCAPGQKEFSSPAMEAEASTSNTEAPVFLNASAKSPRMRRKPGSGADKPTSTRNGKTNFEAAINSCSQLLRRST